MLGDGLVEGRKQKSARVTQHENRPSFALLACYMDDGEARGKCSVTVKVCFRCSVTSLLLPCLDDLPTLPLYGCMTLDLSLNLVCPFYISASHCLHTVVERSGSINDNNSSYSMKKNYFSFYVRTVDGHFADNQDPDTRTATRLHHASGQTRNAIRTMEGLGNSEPLHATTTQVTEIVNEAAPQKHGREFVK